MNVLGTSIRFLDSLRWVIREEKCGVSIVIGRERRVLPRVDEIHSRDDAHHLVEQIAARKIDNNPAVKAWRTAKASTWLLLLAGAFLLFYLISVLKEVFRLV
jgi:hypothetical protein